MTLLERFVKLEAKFRKQTHLLPAEMMTMLYSSGRKFFLKKLAKDLNFKDIIHKDDAKVKLWDIDFNCGLMNAAGMFKKGDSYELCAKQGAGAFLAGTTTFLQRDGNSKKNIEHPFLSYPNSNAASNWMGLPNEGHMQVAKRLSKIDKIQGCPVGISISADPEADSQSGLDGLIHGMNIYEESGVDFIELNESCPNVPHHDSGAEQCGIDILLSQRLEYLYDKFLKRRFRNLPVIVKFSNDTNVEQLPTLIDQLIDLGYDGINLGNTSIRYEYYRYQIDKNDLSNYDYFTHTFGGGLSGKILKDNSLNLASQAAKYLSTKNLQKEFHVIRTGGVENTNDIIASKDNGIVMNQWFSGYFEAFAKNGHKLYKEIYK